MQGMGGQRGGLDGPHEGNTELVVNPLGTCVRMPCPGSRGWAGWRIQVRFFVGEVGPYTEARPDPAVAEPCSLSETSHGENNTSLFDLSPTHGRGPGPRGPPGGDRKAGTRSSREPRGSGSCWCKAPVRIPHRPPCPPHRVGISAPGGSLEPPSHEQRPGRGWDLPKVMPLIGDSGV